MKIKQITAREEKGAHAGGGIVCEVHLTNGANTTTAVSLESFSHQNTATHISPSAIIEYVTHVISPFFEGKIIDLIECDALLEELYRADSPSSVPCSVIQALSVAFATVQSQAEEIQPFELFADLSQNETVTIPYPLFQISDVHVFDTTFPIAKLFLLPLGASSFRHSLGSFEEIQKALKKHPISATSRSVEEIFENLDNLLIQEKLRDVFVVGLQGNAQALYDNVSGNYTWIGEDKNTEELLALYKTFVEKYGVFSMQNCFSDHDILGARTLLETFGDRVQLVASQSLAADDLPALEELKNHANACIVRPDDYITVTKALAHVMQIRSEGVNVIIAQRFASNPAFIVDFAVGTSAGQIKTSNENQELTSALCERLLDIEDTMTFSLL